MRYFHLIPNWFEQLFRVNTMRILEFLIAYLIPGADLTSKFVAYTKSSVLFSLERPSLKTIKK